ncbi:hypothetical protein LZP69_04245 [Shewanella sp. AS1]|uniref:hypothetical protein n=1 Tax=Shewanella sp. AS1 TaxID=2907626 RepID=UPI001F3F6ECF|nr:hypothetical protein [Shewanella sp. AS1]MCE9678408.1 hypothetical protein [Shewanella sp. AS1]
MKLKIIMTLMFTLVLAWVIFHYKAELGIFILPLFILLVVFVTLRLYRLMGYRLMDDRLKENDNSQK